MQLRIMAGIVTFNPDIEKLKKALNSIRCQVSSIILYDNASTTFEKVEDLATQYNVIVMAAKTNGGLGIAYNNLMSYAIDNNFDWVMFLDQDSVLSLDFIAYAQKYMHLDSIGIIAPSIFEKNISAPISNSSFMIDKKHVETNDYLYVKRCINSGALINVDAYRQTEGYEESFFVDYVDFEYCQKLRNKNYKIIILKNVFIFHEIGNSEYVSFLGKKLRYSRHSAEREYFIARNIILYIRKYWKDISVVRDIMSLLKHYFFILIYDKEKKKKLGALRRGVLCGLTSKMK